MPLHMRPQWQRVAETHFTELRLAYAAMPEYDPYSVKGDMIFAGLGYVCAFERDAPRLILHFAPKFYMCFCFSLRNPMVHNSSIRDRELIQR